MAPITQNVTNQIVDALTPLLSTAPAVTSGTPTVNLNVTIINTSVEPTTTASSSLIDSMVNSIVSFCAGLSNIWLGLGGVIMVIVFVVRFCKQRKWPQTPQEELVERQLDVAERMENGLRSIESSVYDHHDLQARQMDLLLKHHGVKDRPCLHPRWECHANTCPPSRSRRYDTWESEQSWPDYGSQESLIPHGPYEQSKPDVEHQSGTDLRSEKKLVDVPSDWIRVSESVVENQSVTDWGSHEKLV